MSLRAPARSTVARAALGIAAVTVLARIVGFARGLVFVRTAGATALGDTYYAANAVPNIVFEIVAGGALAGAVVPVLAGAVAAGDHETVRRTASALLTWVVLLLTPLALIGVAVAHPVMRLLAGGGLAQRPDALAVGSRMLAVFMPQIVLYGVGIALTGVLQAHRRFLGPALAPLLSSVVVIAAYVVFAHEPGSAALSSLSPLREYTLSVGTTLGVAALTLPLLVPLRQLGVRIRPTLHFPPGVSRRLVALAASGFAALAAQQVATAVVLRLSYDGPPGTYVLYNLAWTLFLLPWAVFAVPVATSAFPLLAEHADTGDTASFAALNARTTRAVVLGAALAAAAVAAAAYPVANILVRNAAGHPDPRRLAGAIVAFAPGLLGYGLVAHLGRALYAVHRGRAAAVAIVSGWLAVVVADIALVSAVSPAHRLVALGAGNTLGMTLAGVLLVVALHRVVGRSAYVGLTRTLATAVVGGAVAGAAGHATAAALGAASVVRSIGVGALAGVVAVAVFAAVAAVGDRQQLRAAVHPVTASLAALRRGRGT